jgi:hypothetical protein
VNGDEIFTLPIAIMPGILIALGLTWLGIAALAIVIINAWNANRRHK